MVEESQELEREAARSLAQAADSHATLEGFYAVNDVKPDPKLEQEARQDLESKEGDREKGHPLP
jgi:hypothetical protein